MTKQKTSKQKSSKQKASNQKTFIESINPENLPAQVEEQEYEALQIMVRHAMALPDINPDELIRMQDGGKLGWKIDEEDTTVEVLENVLIWDYMPYWGKWELADGRRMLHKKPLTDPDAEKDGYHPRIDLYVEWEGEERVIGLPTVGYNHFVKKLEHYQNKGQDIRDRRFNLKTKKAVGRLGPLTVPVFREIKRFSPDEQVIDVKPASQNWLDKDVPY